MADLRKAVLGIHGKRPNYSNSRIMSGSKQNFTPVKWSTYFDKEETIVTSQGKFHVYCKGNEGPILLCLHGGGYSGLTWALFADDVSNLINCQIRAVDLRGHGNTVTEDDLDLSLETLVNDVVEIAKKLTENNDNPVILMGHSMGGAIAVNAANSVNLIAGLCVIDVVEGTALDALSSMQSILRGRPSHFKSLPHAIQWCFKGGQTHNLEAARVSMPGQVVNTSSGQLAANECDNLELYKVDLTPSSHREAVTSSLALAEVIEETEEKEESSKCDCGKPPLPKTQKTNDFKTPNDSNVLSTQPPQYRWRIDLSKTEKFWTGWFTGLSHKFLEVRVPKLLLLANIFGLDTTLTVGQMQGKFQLQVMAKSGHAIHEDQPQNVAEILAGYLVKQMIAKPKDGFVYPSLPAC